MTTPSPTPIPQEEFTAALDAIYLEIGRCIAEWYLVEEALNHVHTMTVIPGTMYQANLSASFNEVRSFDARLKMVTAAMDSMQIHPSMKQPYEARSTGWRTVRNKLIDYNIRRNEVAHGTAVSLLQYKGIAYSLPMWIPYFESTLATFSEHYSDMTLEKCKPLKKLSVEDLRETRVMFSNGVRLIQDYLSVHF